MFKSWLKITGIVALTILLAVSCNRCSDNGDSDAPVTILGEPTLTFTPIKTFHFSWADVSDATHYKLLENPDGVSGFTQVGSDIPQGTQMYDHVVPLYARVNAQYILQNCNASGCSDSSTVSVSGTLVDSIGYIKASNTGFISSIHYFGGSVSLSADGNTLAVGAESEDGIAPDSGAVYVFSRSDSGWYQQAYIKASNPGYGCFLLPPDIWSCSGDFFGVLSLSADGNTLAVGASGEDSSATGINGDDTNDSEEGRDSGAVYVFSRSGTTWFQQAYIKASNTERGDGFGASVSLSTDGNTLAVGAIGEESSSTGINGDQTDNSAFSSGAVYLFSRDGTTWFQQAYIKASNTEAFDHFGSSVSLSGDGNTLAVGAESEDSSATGINGDEADNSAGGSGAAYIFSRDGTTWSQRVYIKASNPELSDNFGISVSLSADGNTLAVGANKEKSSATGIDGDQADNLADYAGAVYVFSRDGATWTQQAYIKASNTEARHFFGEHVSLSADGNTLAVGASEEDSNATGINGDQKDNSARDAGAVYLFSRSGTTWGQQAYIKASNTDAVDLFGSSVSLSGDGNTLAVGATHEDSSATGINGDQTDNSVGGSGAAYLY